MRYSDSQKAHYLTGLPQLSPAVNDCIQGQFVELIKTILAALTETNSGDNDLCVNLVYGLTWAYKVDDFGWLA